MSKERLDRLNEVFRDVFNDDDLTISRETSARDIAEWDSVMHVSLIVNVEKAYKSEQEAEATELGGVISRYQARGTRVVVVVMPQGSVYRARVPAEAKQYLLHYLDREFPKPSVTVLDFENTIPDSGFFDNIHMNTSGRAAFTQQLAEAIVAFPEQAGSATR